MQQPKREWNHKMPYPSWPFGIVCPKELTKWGKAHAPKQEQAPF